MALASQVSASTADGCDFTLACVVEFSGYQGLVTGNLRGALNFEVSSLVPGNFAPATATATPGGGGASGSGVSSPKVAATISIISTLLLSSP
jgi:hypothetical protein